MKKLIPIVLLLLFSIGKAQEKSNSTSYFLINTGYTNLNGNYFELGPEFYFIQKNDNIINLSATANMAYFKDQFVIVPEVGIGYLFNTKNPNSKANPYREYINASFYSIRVNASPWNITPELGLPLLGLCEAHLRQSFEYHQHHHPSFDGIKFGITFHIPSQLLL